MLSRADLLTQLSTLLPDNNSGLITPAMHREMVQYLIESCWNLVDDGELISEHRVLSADVPINTTTLTTLADLTFPVTAAGEVWSFEARLPAATDASADLRFQVNAPAASGSISVSTTNRADVEKVDYNTLSNSLQAVQGADIVRVVGGLTTSAAGNVEFQFRNNSGTDTQTFHLGGFVRAWKVA